MNTSPRAAVSALRDLASIPVGEDDEPVFGSPWEARAFALVVQLHQQGHFAWPEWAAQLGEEIRAAGAGDDGAGYYLLWLAAAEKLVAARALCTPQTLSARKAALEAEQGGPAPE